MPDFLHVSRRAGGIRTLHAIFAVHRSSRRAQEVHARIEQLCHTVVQIRKKYVESTDLLWTEESHDLKSKQSSLTNSPRGQCSSANACTGVSASKNAPTGGDGM